MRQNLRFRWLLEAVLSAFMLFAAEAFSQAAVHASAAYYTPGTTVTVTNTFAYPIGSQLTYYYWYPEVPAGLTVSNVRGDGGAHIDWAGGIGFPAYTFPNPVVFYYDVTFSENLTGEQHVPAYVCYNVGGGVTQEMVTPDPLVFAYNAAPVVTQELWIVGYRTTQFKPLANKIAEATLLAQANDPDAGDTLSLTAVNTNGLKGGIVSSGGVLTYTPPAHTDSIVDIFTYTVTDSKGASAVGTVKVRVAYGGTMIRAF